MAKNTDVIIVGGGAAGIFAAVTLAEINPSVNILVLEKTPKLLSKVKISGGGRCNVAHACFDNRELAKYYPRGGKQLMGAFSRFATQQTIDWFESRGVTLKAETDGRMFPTTDRSQTIIDCLLKEATKLGIDIRTHAGVIKVIRTNHGFDLTVNENETIACKYVLVACGGHHKTDAYQWLSDLGHTVVLPVPSLFTFNLPNHPITQLMGIVGADTEVKIATTKLQQHGPVLITHWGLSGPAVLKLSAWGARVLHDAGYHYEAVINWVPTEHEDGMRHVLAQLRKELGPAMVINKHPFKLPKRLWEYLCSKCGISENTRWADLPAKQANLLAIALTNDRYQANGKTTYKEEFVTAGGIDISEVDFKTMQSKLIPGLYFAGEVLDIDGVTGGFNFQAAWTTGYIAGTSIAEESM